MALFFTEERRRMLGRFALRAEITIVVASLCALGFSLLVAAAVIWLVPILGLLQALLVCGGAILLLALAMLATEMLWERLQRGRSEREDHDEKHAGQRDPSSSVATLLLGEGADGGGGMVADASPLVAAVTTSMLDRHARSAPLATLAGLAAVAVAIAAMERRRARREHAGQPQGDRAPDRRAR